MRTATIQIGASLAKGMMRVAGPLWDSSLAYVNPQVVAYGGHTWRADAPTARGHAPQGIGDGTAADRDLLMLQRNGMAAAVSGGYTGPTYTVTRSDDALTGSTPTAGTLRYGLSGQYGIDNGGNYWDPLWIVFDPGLASGGHIDISLDQAGAQTPLKVAPNRTVDGRGTAEVRVTFPRNDVTPLKGFSHSGVIGPANSGTPWNRDGAGWTGVSNVIWAYLTIRNLSIADVTCEVFEGAGYGADLRWYHHLDLAGGADIVLSALGQFDYFIAHPEFGIHAESVLSRVTIDWCRLGPAPIATAWQYTLNKTADPYKGAYFVADNQASDGKVSLMGLHPQDGYAPDNLRVSLHHCRYVGGMQRQPKAACARIHAYNNWVDRYGIHIGLADPGDMAVPTDLSVAVPGGTALGWSPTLLATLDDARHKTWPYPVWDCTQVNNAGVGYAAEASRDGELLLESNVWSGYTEGQDHYINDDLVALGVITSGQRWKVYGRKPETIVARVKHGTGDNSWPDALIVSRGEMMEGSAAYGSGITSIAGSGYAPDHRVAPFGGIPPLFRGWRNGHYNTTNLKYVLNSGNAWVQDGSDWGGVPPYDYVLRNADSALKADLTAGSGNVRPWTRIS